MGNSLAAPAVASEGSGKFAAVGSCKHRESQLPDRSQSLAENGRRTEQDTVGKEKLLFHSGLVRLHHIVGAHVNIAAVLHSLCNFLRQLFRIAVGAYIGDDNRFFSIGIDHSGPFLVFLHDRFNGVCRVENRAMSGADHGNIHGFYPV